MALDLTRRGLMKSTAASGALLLCFGGLRPARSAELQAAGSVYATLGDPGYGDWRDL